MIVVHGSGGLDDRNVRWARWFRENGIATFQIDYFGPRGVSASSSFQPTPVHDSYDALRLLATHPKIDPTRIGIIGFSRGGNIALETANATAADAGGYRFAGHVALYPSCGLVGVREGGSGAPVLVLVGTRDDLVPVFQCELMAESARARGRDVVLKVYEGAYHSWDGDFNGEWFQRSINRSYRMYSDQSITRQSEKDVLEFLNNTLMRAR
jgi:dienelactone hydrolase